MQWKQHSIRQISDTGGDMELPAQFQIITEAWRRQYTFPNMVYMPEKDRLLLLVASGYSPVAMVTSSDDRGETWDDPRYLHSDSLGKPDAGTCVGLTYLGNGKVLASAVDGKSRWFSNDYGESWGPPVLISAIAGKHLWLWDPCMVDTDPETDEVILLAEAGHTGDGINSQGYIRFSTDSGLSWSNAAKIPEWEGVNEVALLRARNGDIIAACRTDNQESFKHFPSDHFSGLGISVSKDNGQTWSKLTMLYYFGRHHPSMVLMPSGDIVMTYVVRLGYPDTDDGYSQFGIEAVVSHDNGHTWDMKQHYVLAMWQGNRKGPNSWWASPNASSSVLLPDGHILTAFGTGYRSYPNEKGEPEPMDIGLVKWRVEE